MVKKIALVGNPNSGKTTFYNGVTGAREKVGNRSGVTVDISGRKIKGSNYILYDLPGIYSLSANSKDERAACDFLNRKEYDCIINIVDGTNLLRNLYLTVSLAFLNVPMIVAVNMADEMGKENVEIDIVKLSKIFGIKFIMISAKENKNIFNVIDNVENSSLASKTLLNIWEKYYLLGTINDDEIKKANASYKTVDEILERCTHKNALLINKNEKTDKIMLNKILSIPIFLCIMITIFYLTFGPLGNYLKNHIVNIYSHIVTLPLRHILENVFGNTMIFSLVGNGILNAVETVVSFFPQIMLLFIFLSLLEDSGYMSRIAFITDKPLRKIGLSGQSFVSIIMGFGCTTTAVMSSRTIKNDKERKLCIFLIPYISCTAKLPIYMVFAQTFFNEKTVGVIFFLYIIGIVTSILIGMIFGSYDSKNSEFILELPKYRIPSFRNIIRLVLNKLEDFVKRAGITIVIMSTIFWFLQNFDLNFNAVNNASESIIGETGKIISPLFLPLGFGKWQAVMPLIFGLAAKETVISSFAVIGNNIPVEDTLRSIFNEKSALSYMVFTLLYIPCFSALATMKKELGDKKVFISSVIMHFIIAYIISFVVYNLSKIIS